MVGAKQGSKHDTLTDRKTYNCGLAFAMADVPADGEAAGHKLDSLAPSGKKSHTDDAL